MMHYVYRQQKEQMIVVGACGGRLQPILRTLGITVVTLGLVGGLGSAALADQDPYDHSSQEQCPRTSGMVIGRPEISVAFEPGRRVPTFSWTTKCPNLSGFRFRWNFVYPDGNLTGALQEDVTGYAFTPPEPEDPNVTAVTVSVIDNDGFGGVGYSGSGRVPLQVIPPTSPGTPILIDNGDGRVTVNWTAPQSDGGSSVTYSVTTTPSTEGCTTTGTTCLLKGLTVDSTYDVVVQARNAAGAGPISAMNSITPAGPRLLAPTGVSARVTGATIRVTWRPPGGQSTTTKIRYRVSSRPSGLLCRTSGTSCTFRRLDPGTTASFIVTAVRGAKRTSSWPSPTVRTPLPPSPVSPTPSDTPEPTPKPEQDLS